MKKEFLVKSGKKEFRLALTKNDGSEGSVNDKPFTLDVIKTGTGFHILQNNKGYTVDVLDFDREKKNITLRINRKQYVFAVRDQYDELLDKLGIGIQGSGKITNIKAPMPGLVLDVLVKAGDVVKVNQALVILEAMKMENVIKSPYDSVVKKIEISKGDSVEKNQLLVAFN